MKERAFSDDLLLQDWSAGNGKPNLSPKSLDQRIGPTHPHNQLENASAPLRLCARPPVPDGMVKPWPHTP